MTNSCPICGRCACRLCPKDSIPPGEGNSSPGRLGTPAPARDLGLDCYLLEIGPVFCLGRAHLVVRRVQWVWLWQIVTRWLGIPCRVLAIEVWQGAVWTQVTAAEIWDGAEQAQVGERQEAAG